MRILLLLLALTLAGCESLGYYAQSAQGQLSVSLKSRPIADVLQDDALSQAHKKRLLLAQDMLQFAQHEMDLPAGYQRYVDVGREALVWSVVAAPRFSLQPKQWCYPVIGCASYRGYFSKAAAERYAKRLAAQGWDVAVERVPAYSTLGWFDDPIPNTVIDWPEAEFAGLLFHELAHRKVYAKDDSAFNESYARVVEHAGIAAWLRQQSNAEQQLCVWQQRQTRAQQFNQLLQKTRERLLQLYAKPLPDAVWARRKAELFEQLRAEYRDLRASWQGYAGYDGWMQRSINNAHLASVDTYSRWQGALQCLLEDKGNDWSAFHQAAQSLADSSVAQRAGRLRALARRANCASRTGANGQSFLACRGR